MLLKSLHVSKNKKRNDSQFLAKLTWIVLIIKVLINAEKYEYVNCLLRQDLSITPPMSSSSGKF